VYYPAGGSKRFPVYPTSEDDAEIFSCAAHSEEEADEIVGVKHYWLSVLIGVQAIEDLSPK
jgi:hypothetical protein